MASRNCFWVSFGSQASRARASVRSGRWLIPAFHVAIDAGIRGGHDDPQNFEIAAFAGSIERLTTRLTQSRQAATLDEAATAEIVARSDDGRD